jgi:hypothetical protein
MHREVQTHLKELATLCQTVLLGDQEWQRLYEIAVCLHTNGGLQDPKVVSRFLMEHGCSLHKAGFLSRQVLHLCTVLQKYDDHRINSAKGVASKQEMTLLWICLFIMTCLIGIWYFAAVDTPS